MEINVFKLCSGLKFLGYLMILLVAAIIAVSYHAIVIVTCGPQLLRGGAHSVLAFAIIMIFHLLLIMLLWSYYRVVFKDPGSVPENWRAVLPEEALEAGSSLNDRPDCVVDTDGLDRRAFCNYCQNGKPPRCHHCSVCQRCVLKMDHHCVWVVNCVGARNYKFFLLFLLYTFMVTTMDTLVLLPAFINFFGEAKDHSSSPGDLAVIFLAFVLNLAFALSLLCFLVMHASLLSSNTTSIEVYEKRGAARWKYDLGRKKNFEQVFGTKKALWFFPLFSKEDVDNIPALHGLDFPIRADPES
ncbi:PROTEIN S-ACYLTRANSFERASE 12-RELATED [Salix purpurea]|uniref:S-acyltransferase n=1 Tax=Salix purpurea TaxID=77065 RepID=A0A9Q0SK75_SALPP|nr:PROTEIN S-ACYLTRANSFERASE 12-RELATED [Salix purpurea]